MVMVSSEFVKAVFLQGNRRSGRATVVPARATVVPAKAGIQNPR